MFDHLPGTGYRASGAEGAAGADRGSERQIAVLEELVPGEDAAARRKQALATYAAMVGAIVLARAVDDEAMSLEVLEAVRASMPGT